MAGGKIAGVTVRHAAEQEGWGDGSQGEDVSDNSSWHPGNLPLQPVFCCVCQLCVEPSGRTHCLYTALYLLTPQCEGLKVKRLPGLEIWLL